MGQEVEAEGVAPTRIWPFAAGAPVAQECKIPGMTIQRGAGVTRVYREPSGGQGSKPADLELRSIYRGGPGRY